MAFIKYKTVDSAKACIEAASDESKVTENNTMNVLLYGLVFVLIEL